MMLWIPVLNNIHVDWRLAAINPGFAIVGDETSWDFAHNEEGFFPPSVTRSPSATWLGYVVHIDPIRIQPVELDLKAAAIYYRRMVINAGDETEDKVMRRPLLPYVTRRTCERDQDMQIEESAEAVAILPIVRSNVYDVLKGRGFGPDS